MPLQGWDPVRIVSQIVAFQTLHYLLLATLVPPLLAIFAETSSLMFEGGPTQVGMLFDWRQIAAQPTYDWQTAVETTVTKTGSGSNDQLLDPNVVAQWNLDNVWLDRPQSALSGLVGSAGGIVMDHEQILRFKHLRNGTNTPEEHDDRNTTTTTTTTPREALEHWEWDHTRDASRSWVLICTWFISIPLDILLLVYLVRRPTHMLDHTLTFHLYNLLVVSYYSASLPTSLSWWITMLIHAAVTIVWSEQLAIQREMNRSIGYNLVGAGSDDPLPPTGRNLKRKQSSAPATTTTEVIFDAHQPQRHYRDQEETIELKQF